MSMVQHRPHDLTECGATVIVSKDDVFGDLAEILQLSNEVSVLVAELTEEEKAKLPPILIAPKDSYAMKFYSHCGCCSQRFITSYRPTEADLDQKSREISFVK